jgi:enterochelin esterase-like enzyme
VSSKRSFLCGLSLLLPGVLLVGACGSGVGRLSRGRGLRVGQRHPAGARREVATAGWARPRTAAWAPRPAPTGLATAAPGRRWSACTIRRGRTRSRCAAAPRGSTGRPVCPRGSGDTFSLTLTGVTTKVEWKPLLDDTTWAIGPNYHVASGQTVDIWPHFTTMTGQVETLIADFHSTILGDDRAIYAYLPASYAENTDATYPVVYMHDGQNLWAALPQLAFSGTWNVDTAFDTASQLGACSSATVVGWGAQPLGGRASDVHGRHRLLGGAGVRHVPRGHRHRRREQRKPGARLHAHRRSLRGRRGPRPQGGADQYLQMLIQELKPLVDGMLRTRPDVGSTAMAGSSLGGLVTAYAGLKHADVYGRIAELSPSSGGTATSSSPTSRARPPRPRARSSSTSTRARARSTTRRTPTCWRRPTSGSATSTGRTSAT